MCNSTSIRANLAALRAEMAAEGIDVFFIQSGDPHNSEFVNDYYNSVRFISGFTGENATLLVLEEEAYLWTDGRFFLQAQTELDGTGITLMKMGMEGVPSVEEYLQTLCDEYDFTLGFDGNVTTAEMGMALDDFLEDNGETTVYEYDLISRIWHDRPAIEPGPIFELPFEATGMSAQEKLYELQFAMESMDADYLLVSDLMEVAWLTNLRGSDIDYTPVFFGYALINSFQPKIFVMEGALGDDALESIEAAGYTVCKYGEIEDAVASIPPGTTLWYSPYSTNYSLSLSLADGVGIIEETTPVEMMKACKNDVEIASTIEAHKKDGVAVTSFIAWLKNRNIEETLTELEASSYLKDCRFRETGCFDLSFETIAAYGPNGAIIHYMPTEASNATIEPHGFLLVDSGGQYIDGTTDITRTIAMGPLSDKEKQYYTLVLKSHIAMATLRFDGGTLGKVIDAHARKPMQDAGLDFNHGLGHGVGHILGVHENPNVLGRKSGEQYPRVGMIMSDEPGVYIENEFGIRIENEVVVRDYGIKLGFEPITYVPYEREAIIIDMLTEEEIQWIDSYHAKVRETLLPRLTDQCTIDYLNEAAAPLRG